MIDYISEDELLDDELVYNFINGVGESCKNLMMLIAESNLLDVGPFREGTSVLSSLNLAILLRIRKYTDADREDEHIRFKDNLTKTIDLITTECDVKSPDSITVKSIGELIKNLTNIRKQTSDSVENLAIGFHIASMIAIGTGYGIYNTERNKLQKELIIKATNLVNEYSRLIISLLEMHLKDIK
jgi:hypothetical protein